MTRACRFARVLTAAAVLAASGPAAGQVRNWPSEPVPKPLASRPVAFPPYEVRTLANGLRVVVVEHHEQPTVSLRLLVGAGTAQDAAPKLGVASMVASLLDQGTATRSAQQTAETVDAVGGDLSVGAGTDVTFLGQPQRLGKFGGGLSAFQQKWKHPVTLFHVTPRPSCIWRRRR